MNPGLIGQVLMIGGALICFAIGIFFVIVGVKMVLEAFV